MHTKTIIITVVLLIGGLLIWRLINAPPEVTENAQGEDGSMSGAPGADNMIKEVDEDTMMEMKEMVYTYSGSLTDVTTGEIRGINTNGQASGVARADFNDGKYLLLATFENLPDPANDDFYEGWLVQKSPFKFISTGIVEKNDGTYMNTYSSGEDLTPYSFYVLTIEPNDNNPAPADHIVEGDMLKQ